MRSRDEEKQAALIEATVTIVNEVGFGAAAVSKIAKEANVSPATLYIYFNNKEDLLVSTYIAVKKNFSRSVLKTFDGTLPIRDILRNTWFAMRKYISENKDYFRFTEQFAQSPYHTLVRREDVEKFFTPIIEVLQRGIDEKVIKNVEIDILTAFIYFPLLALSNPRLCTNFELTEENIETAFALAWDAIKL